MAAYNNGDIQNSYSQVDIEVSFVQGYNEMEAGGLVAENQPNGVIHHSYAAGEIKITGGAGVRFGIVVKNEGSLMLSYWDTNLTGVSEGVGTGNPDGTTGLTTAEMTGSAAEASMPEFDWQAIWRTTDGYPALRWQED